MIKFHHHRARTAVPRLGIEVGDPLCHAYSDTSLEELVRWGRRHGLKPSWIDTGHALPHFDLHGDQLELAGEGVEGRELARDIRAWRERERDQ